MKTFCAAIATIILLAGPAHAGLKTNGLKTNGLTINGLRVNGLNKTNGCIKTSGGAPSSHTIGGVVAENGRLVFANP